jgi:hypothetical protein
VGVLGAGLALLLFVLGSLTAWQVAQTGEQELRQREAQMLGDTARYIAGHLGVALEERRADLLTLRDLLELDFAQAAPAQRRALLGRTLDSHPHFSWLGVADRQGRIVLGAHGMLENESVAGLDWFDAGLAGAEFYGELHAANQMAPHLRQAPSGERPVRMLDIALPLRASAPTGRAAAEIIGVLGSHLDERILSDLLSQAPGSRVGAQRLDAAVVDRNGNILYDTQGVRGALGALLQPPTAPASGAAPTLHMNEAVWPGNTQLGSYFVAADLPDASWAARALQWRVVVRSAAGQLHDDVRQLHLRVTAVCLGVGLLFAVAGGLLLNGTTASLQHLVDDMRRFAITGEPPAPRPASRIAEVARLHGSLLAMTRHVAQQRHAQSEGQRQIVQALARAGEYRDNDTGQHVLRMSHCAGRLAELAGLDSATADQIRLAAQLHDIGKIGIPDAVLLKHGRIDEAERAIMHRHPEIGAAILAGFDAPLLMLARTVAYTHHERWDGGGYPRGLAGEAIPLAGRIVSLCDVFDALLSTRTYKPGWPLERTLDWLRQQSGSHFDPRLTELLLTHVADFVRIRAESDAQAPATTDSAISLGSLEPAGERSDHASGMHDSAASVHAT